jgi:hypothetical protein
VLLGFALLLEVVEAEVMEVVLSRPACTDVLEVEVMSVCVDWQMVAGGVGRAADDEGLETCNSKCGTLV